MKSHYSRTLVLLTLTMMCGAEAVGAQKPVDPGKGSLTRTPGSAVDPKDGSHSQNGSAFDQGPRQLAHLQKGLGNVHFPITTKSVEAQKFFDQGVNLLYSFSWFEAERSFRQAAKIDPDCPMAYWGMAMCDNGRGKEFIKLAVAKKEKATDRERRYIEALAINFREGKDAANKVADNLRALESLVLAYPDDVEAKAIYAWALKQQGFEGGVSNRLAIDSLLKQVLAKNPLHPGANHYRIHLWDGSSEARQALDSCRAYPKSAPNIGHAQHMPGHIYAQLGMWDQAAFAMDAAARAERRYFYEQQRMPWESWNYGHDQDFLIANLGYTGRIKEGIALSRELLDGPHDPDFNSGGGYSIGGEGRFSLMRMWVRGERWNDILQNASLIDGDSTDEKAWKLYALALAAMGTGDLESAQKHATALEQLKAGGDIMECARLEVTGRLKIMQGTTEPGLADLKKASDIEKAKFRYNDPPPYPRPLYESLAWGQITTKRWADAEATLREGLKREPGNGFGHALLVEALTGEGKREDARAAYDTLKSVWSHADPDLAPLRRAASFRSGVQTAALESARPVSFVTPYPRVAELEKLGPIRWKPFSAADFTLADAEGKPVRLSDFRGHNVLLVFYLGNACLECQKQLTALGQEKAAFDALDTRLVAASPESLEALQRAVKDMPPSPFLRLSDSSSTAGRKFHAYDEFEGLPLHATILINRQGQVWWFRAGSEPFTNVNFLKTEIPRMEAWLKQHDG